ncbi:ArsR/SmtB family transcription factor [Caenispirillum salinarum]|uniref:ArsR/SmtB family transcription factor n=1 Tax=Caenispirillum salinarum TaxID=859058 RepID=UPI00384DFEE0
MTVHTTSDSILDTDAAAAVLAELGNGTRLTIFRLLVHAGPEGLAVGDIQGRLGIPWSTLSHHISRLVRVGLLEQVRDGRTLLCRPRHETLNAVMAWLTEECNLPYVAEAHAGSAGAWRGQVPPPAE